MAEAVQINVAKALDKGFDASKIRRIEVDLSPLCEIQSGLALVLENVFTSEECEELIRITEAEGYSPALIHSGKEAFAAPGYRDGHRIMIDDRKFSDKLFERISKFLPDVFEGKKLIEINERLRFLRYYQDDQFKPHSDASYARPDNSAKTLITLQMYLNEGFDGGETTFLGYGDEGDVRIPVVPKTGMILVFEHRLYHEGSLVKSGTKYTIRTDVLYTTKCAGGQPSKCSLL